MKKSILNLNGAQELSKNEQKALNGGGFTITPTKNCNPKGLIGVRPDTVVISCPVGQCCSSTLKICVPNGHKSCFTIGGTVGSF